jgi:hypothetical protein
MSDFLQTPGLDSAPQFELFAELLYGRFPLLMRTADFQKRGMPVTAEI